MPKKKFGEWIKVTGIHEDGYTWKKIIWKEIKHYKRNMNEAFERIVFQSNLIKRGFYNDDC